MIGYGELVMERGGGRYGSYIPKFKIVSKIFLYNKTN